MRKTFLFALCSFLTILLVSCSSQNTEIDALKREIEQLKQQANTVPSSENSDIAKQLEFDVSDITDPADTYSTPEPVQVIYVDYPPDTHLPCADCESSGSVFCDSCDGTGKKKLGEDTPAQVLPGGFLVPAIPATVVNCLSCFGKKEHTCYTCWGSGEIRNPDYIPYVTDLKQLSRESGVDIFMLDFGRDHTPVYIAAIDCSVCGTSGYFEGYLCEGCQGARYKLYYPESPYEDIAEINRNAQLINEIIRNNTYNQPAQYYEGVSSDDEWYQSSGFQRQCIKNGCSAYAESGSSYCSLHQDSLSYNQYCAETGCYNPPASSSLYCARHQP